MFLSLGGVILTPGKVGGDLVKPRMPGPCCAGWARILRHMGFPGRASNAGPGTAQRGYEGLGKFTGWEGDWEGVSRAHHLNGTVWLTARDSIRVWRVQRWGLFVDSGPQGELMGA